MNIQDRKIVLAEKLFKIRNENLIEQMEKLVEKQMIVGYTTAGEPLTLKQYNARLEKAEDSYKAGNWLSQQDAEKEAEKW